MLWSDFRADLGRDIFPHLKLKTRQRYKTVLDNMEAILRPDSLAELDLDAAKRWKNARAGAAEPGTVNLELRHLAAALNHAVEARLMDENPFALIDPLPAQKTEPRGLSVAERGSLLVEAKRRRDVIYEMAMTFLWSGLRLQEATHLQAEHIDPAQNWIKIIPRACAACPGCRANENKWTPKTYEQRNIPIWKDLRPLLARIVREKRSGLVFESYSGMWTERALEKAFEKVFNHAKIEGAGIHDLRHSFGSEMIRRGVDVPTLQKWMGHRRIETTMIYVHIEGKHSQAAMRRAAENLLKK
jgi:site-specific recombinase XerD